MSTWATGADVFTESGENTLSIQRDEVRDFDYSLMSFYHILTGRRGFNQQLPAYPENIVTVKFPEWLPGKIQKVSETERYSDYDIIVDKKVFDKFNLENTFTWQCRNPETKQFEDVTQSYSDFISCDEVNKLIKRIQETPGDYVVLWFNP